MELNNSYSDRFICIGNKGQAITSTNYWDSEQAREGLCLLSWNAGAARLLVPDSKKHFLIEMRGTKHVIVSRGPWLSEDNRDSLELLFEDLSDTPFVIITTMEASLLVPSNSFCNHDFVFSVWTRGGQKFCFPGKYRVVDSLPCLKEWGK